MRGPREIELGRVDLEADARVRHPRGRFDRIAETFDDHAVDSQITGRYAHLCDARVHGHVVPRDHELRVIERGDASDISLHGGRGAIERRGARREPLAFEGGPKPEARERAGYRGGEARRITFRGTYNVSPRVSPDGKTLAFVARTNGVFRLSTLDISSPGQQERVITDTDKDESPSFAPNGRMLLYATDIGGRGILATVSVDGQTKQRISVTAADAREPAWGPYNK